MLLLKYRFQSALFFVLAAIYIAQTALLKPTELVLRKYDITANEAKILGLAVAIPYILIWFVALVGYLRLKKYSDSITKGKDAEAFRLITIGVFWLVLWLPLSTIIKNEVIHVYTLHPSWVENMVRLNNYVNLLLVSPGFTYIYLGSKKLIAIPKSRLRTPSQALVISYISFSALYTFLVLNDPVRHTASGEAIKATYYQPDWLIIVTLVIPRLVFWYLGFHAAQNIYLYSSTVKGSLYRKAIYWFAIGICGVVIGTIVLRCFQSLSVQFASLNLRAVFVVLYLLLGILSAGYIAMLKGTRKLLYLENLS